MKRVYHVRKYNIWPYLHSPVCKLNINKRRADADGNSESKNTFRLLLLLATGMKDLALCDSYSVRRKKHLRFHSISANNVIR